MEAFPPLRPSVYALPDADRTELARMLGKTTASRAVLTQPAPYADEPAAMLDAIANGPGAYRAVAVASPSVDEARLTGWRNQGVEGLRFAEMRAPGGARYPGSEPFESLIALAPRMKVLGLHAQLWASAAQLAEWLPRLIALDIPLVLDHMGCPDVERGIDAPEFKAILDSLESGQVWVKLVLARVSKNQPGCEDARPFHDALVAAAPDRMIWGSDWPYVRLEPAPDASRMLATFLDWVTDAATQRAILVDNPIKLYGFPERLHDTY